MQAVLLASDCNPKWLTKHLPGLASSRRVPLIFVRDMKSGSLRLGEVVKLKTAIAIGVKVISQSSAPQVLVIMEIAFLLIFCLLCRLKVGGSTKLLRKFLVREPTKGAESDES